MASPTTLNTLCVSVSILCIFALTKSACGTPLVGKQYKVHKENELIYCPSCLEKEVATVRPEAHPCAMCGQPIVGMTYLWNKLILVGAYLKIKGQFLHPSHFRCEECGCEFKGGDCREFEGDYYCIPVLLFFGTSADLS